VLNANAEHVANMPVHNLPMLTRYPKFPTISPFLFLSLKYNQILIFNYSCIFECVCAVIEQTETVTCSLKAQFCRVWSVASPGFGARQAQN